MRKKNRSTLAECSLKMQESAVLHGEDLMDDNLELERRLIQKMITKGSFFKKKLTLLTFYREDGRGIES